MVVPPAWTAARVGLWQLRPVQAGPPSRHFSESRSDNLGGHPSQGLLRPKPYTTAL